MCAFCQSHELLDHGPGENVLGEKRVVSEDETTCDRREMLEVTAVLVTIVLYVDAHAFCLRQRCDAEMGTHAPLGCCDQRLSPFGADVWWETGRLGLVLRACEVDVVAEHVERDSLEHDCVDAHAQPDGLCIANVFDILWFGVVSAILLAHVGRRGGQPCPCSWHGDASAERELVAGGEERSDRFEQAGVRLPLLAQ